LSGSMPSDGFPPPPSCPAALHHFLTSLWGQGHESELKVKGRNEGFWGPLSGSSLRLCGLASLGAGTPQFTIPVTSSCSQMTTSHLSPSIYISNCHCLLLINYLVTWPLLSVCECLFHVKGPIFFHPNLLALNPCVAF
jgi:hypothetical protein